LGAKEDDVGVLFFDNAAGVDEELITEPSIFGAKRITAGSKGKL
jgi:hypothetical protein